MAHADEHSAGMSSSLTPPSPLPGAAALPDMATATSVTAAQSDAESHVHKLRSLLASSHATSTAPPTRPAATTTPSGPTRARATSDDASVGEEVGALKRALAKARMDNAQLVFRVSSLSNALERVHVEAHERGSSSLRDAIVAERTAGAVVHEGSTHSSVEHMPPTVKATAAAFQVRAPPPPPPGISATVVEEEGLDTPDGLARQRSFRAVRRGASQSSLKALPVAADVPGRGRTDTSSSGEVPPAAVTAAVVDGDVAAEVWEHAETPTDDMNVNAAAGRVLEGEGDSPQPPPSPPPLPPPEPAVPAQRSITLTKEELRAHISEAVSRAVSEAVSATSERMKVYSDGITKRDEQLAALREAHARAMHEVAEAHAVADQLQEEMEDLRQELQRVSRASAEKDAVIDRLQSKLHEAEDAAASSRVHQEQALMDAAASVRSEYADWLKYHETRLEEAREAASAEILQRELVEARMRIVTNDLDATRAASRASAAEVQTLRDLVAKHTSDAGSSVEDRIAAARREWEAAAQEREAQLETAFHTRIATVRAEVQAAAAVAMETACNQAASSALARASADFRQQLTDALRNMRDSMEAERETAVRTAVQGARHEYESVMHEWEEATERWRRETIATCEATLHNARAQVVEARGQVTKLETAVAQKDGEIAQLRASLSSSSPSAAPRVPVRTPLHASARKRTPTSRGPQKKPEAPHVQEPPPPPPTVTPLRPRTPPLDGWTGTVLMASKSPPPATPPPLTATDAPGAGVSSAAAPTAASPAHAPATPPPIPTPPPAPSAAPSDSASAVPSVRITLSEDGSSAGVTGPPPVPLSSKAFQSHRNMEAARAYAAAMHAASSAETAGMATEIDTESAASDDFEAPPDTTRSEGPAVRVSVARELRRAASDAATYGYIRATSPLEVTGGDAPEPESRASVPVTRTAQPTAAAAAVDASSSNVASSPAAAGESKPSRFFPPSASMSQPPTRTPPPVPGASSTVQAANTSVPAPAKRAAGDGSDDGSIPSRLHDAILSMTVASLRSMLAKAGIPCDDCVEKRDLQERLITAVKRGQATSSTTAGSRPAARTSDDGAHDSKASKSPEGAPSTTTAAASSPQELKNWIAAQAADGSTYYWHRVTRAVRWDKPDLETARRVEARIAGMNDGVQKRLAELAAEEEAAKRDSARKSAMEGDIETRVRVWARGKNIKAMLSSLDAVLLTKEVPDSIASLAAAGGPDDVKKAYMRAVRIVHPDKSSTAPLEAQVEAHKVFTVLSDAYRKYSSVLDALAEARSTGAGVHSSATRNSMHTASTGVGSSRYTRSSSGAPAAHHHGPSRDSAPTAGFSQAFHRAYAAASTTTPAAPVSAAAGVKPPVR